MFPFTPLAAHMYSIYLCFLVLSAQVIMYCRITWESYSDVVDVACVMSAENGVAF